MNIKYNLPLTDKQKELIYNVKIENLTLAEVLDKYGDYLSEEEINKIKSIIKDEKEDSKED